MRERTAGVQVGCRNQMIGKAGKCEGIRSTGGEAVLPKILAIYFSTVLCPTQ